MSMLYNVYCMCMYVLYWVLFLLSVLEGVNGTVSVCSQDGNINTPLSLRIFHGQVVQLCMLYYCIVHGT